jgi:hypothetical protein
LARSDGKDERADVTTDGQVSLSNGTVHVSGPGHYLREAALGPRPSVRGLLPQVAMGSA